jgi:hypothetical protein
MTAAGTHSPTVGIAAALTARRKAAAIARLARLYLVSRRVPAALGLLAALGALLAAALHGRWYIAGGPAAQHLIPLTIETAAAAIVAVSTYSPFGEPEQATGRLRPYLRLACAVMLTSAAGATLAAGATAGHLPGGNLAIIRDLAGITGTGLLAATALGGAFGWTGPMAYLLVTESALSAGWNTPWIWASRPPHDIHAALCAAVIFASGAVLVTVRGDRGWIARSEHRG